MSCVFCRKRRRVRFAYVPGPEPPQVTELREAFTGEAGWRKFRSGRQTRRWAQFDVSIRTHNGDPALWWWRCGEDWGGMFPSAEAAKADAWRMLFDPMG